MSTYECSGSHFNGTDLEYLIACPHSHWCHKRSSTRSGQAQVTCRPCNLLIEYVPCDKCGGVHLVRRRLVA